MSRKQLRGLAKQLWPELAGHDKEVIGDIALRRIIAEIHVEALSDTRRRMDRRCHRPEPSVGFRPVRYNGAGETMEWQRRRIFPGQGHTYWLEKRITRAEVESRGRKGSFRRGRNPAQDTGLGGGKDEWGAATENGPSARRPQRLGRSVPGGGARPGQHGPPDRLTLERLRVDRAEQAPSALRRWSRRGARVRSAWRVRR